MQYIIYHDKSHELAEDKIADLIWAKSAAGMKGVEIAGKKYIFSSIAKILKEDDYFTQYPEKRPPEIRDQFEDVYGAQGNQQIRQPTVKAKELMKQGFFQYHIEKGKIPQQAEEKYRELLQSGIDYRLTKKLKYNL